ncbi:hypothetical protein CH063_12814, partial [Colletotrichum higginsianum]
SIVQGTSTVLHSSLAQAQLSLNSPTTAALSTETLAYGANEVVLTSAAINSPVKYLSAHFDFLHGFEHTATQADFTSLTAHRNTCTALHPTLIDHELQTRPGCLQNHFNTSHTPDDITVRAS